MYRKKSLRYSIALFLLAIHAILIFFASDKKSDTVAILAGVDFETRKKEASRLIANGYSTSLMIPSRGELLHATHEGTLPVPLSINTKLRNFIMQTDNSNQDDQDRSGWPYARTHIEVLLAKDMMEAAGFFSAIIVSHPYHMRRSKMIATRVFGGDDYHLYFVPACNEMLNKKWWLSKNEWKWIVQEYVKIVWFLLYTHIPGLVHV